MARLCRRCYYLRSSLILSCEWPSCRFSNLFTRRSLPPKVAIYTLGGFAFAQQDTLALLSGRPEPTSACTYAASSGGEECDGSGINVAVDAIVKELKLVKVQV